MGVNKMKKEERKIWFKRHPVWTGIIAFFVLIVLIGSCSTDVEEQETVKEEIKYQCADNTFVSNPTDCPKVEPEIKEVEVIKEVEIFKEPVTKEITKTSVVEEESNKATMGEKNALNTALSYLSYSSFSYSGLIRQLEYEGYTYREAVYGVDNCGANWNEQAALKAQSYLDYTAFSREGLIEQLEYEGFTKTQAEYGVQVVGY